MSMSTGININIRNGGTWTVMRVDAASRSLLLWLVAPMVVQFTLKSYNKHSLWS